LALVAVAQAEGPTPDFRSITADLAAVVLADIIITTLMQEAGSEILDLELGLEGQMQAAVVVEPLDTAVVLGGLAW
jgi:hypothetical protein